MSHFSIPTSSICLGLELLWTSRENSKNIVIGLGHTWDSFDDACNTSQWKHIKQMTVWNIFWIWELSLRARTCKLYIMLWAKNVNASSKNQGSKSDQLQISIDRPWDLQPMLKRLPANSSHEHCEPCLGSVRWKSPGVPHGSAGYDSENK